MRGFLLTGKDPPYHKFLDSIDMAAHGTGNSNISFWQFGTSVSEIKPADRHDQKTYLPRSGYENNDYKVVVDGASPATLTVVVTDLFQSDNDFAAVAADIQSHYFTAAKIAPAAAASTKDGGGKTVPETPAMPKPAAVAILGTKLPFNGPIFDMGRDHATLPAYKGDRPVYVLAFGERNEVLQYIKSLKDDLKANDLPSQPEELLLTPDLVSCLPVIDVPLVNQEQMDKLGPDAAGGLLVTNADVTEDLTTSKHPLIKQFVVAGDSATVKLAAPVTPLEFLGPLGQDSLAVKYLAEKWTDQSPSSFRPAPEAADALQFKPVIMPKTCAPTCILRLDGDLHTSKLAVSAIYRFAVRVELNRENAVEPAWVKLWSFTPPQQDGSKTENLAPFLFTLRSQILNREPPVMLRAFFYVKEQR